LLRSQLNFNQLPQTRAVKIFHYSVYQTVGRFNLLIISLVLLSPFEQCKDVPFSPMCVECTEEPCYSCRQCKLQRHFDKYNLKVRDYKQAKHLLCLSVREFCLLDCHSQFVCFVDMCFRSMPKKNKIIALFHRMARVFPTFSTAFLLVSHSRVFIQYLDS
jgi:hypothetical protein